jgi:hypothetical protein
MIRTTARFAACLALFGVGACTDLQSSDLKTAGMSAHINVTADGSGASTSAATLNVDSNITDYVQLTAGDTLVTTVAGQTQTMAATTTLGIITYSAGFTSEDAAGTSYTVALNRSAGNTSAPSSTVTMPAPFTVSAPASSQSFSRANNDITVTYSGSGQPDAMSWTTSGDCINLASASISGDPGTFVIAKGTLALQGSNQTQNCTVTLTLSRTRVGTLDTAYYGGAITAAQQRTVTFTSTP